MQLKSDFSYVECKTLTGKKLLVGLKNSNSYIQINKDYVSDFYKLLTKLDENPLENYIFTEKEKILIKIFNKKGFFEGDECNTKSFNEYSNFVKIILKKDLLSIRNIKLNNINIFYSIYMFIWIVGTFYLFKNFNIIQRTINFKGTSIVEWISIGILIPTIIYISHEFGHFIVAQFLGIKVSRLIIGFFVCCPVIYLEYNGLNLNTTVKKLSVISAGILIHIINTCIGIVLFKLGFNSIILDVWIVANSSMILTNLMLFGPSDGYFFINSLLGIYNLRYKGYKALNSLLNRYKVSSLSTLEKTCGILLVLFWTFSFYGVTITLTYYGGILSIPQKYISIVSIIFITLSLGRFIMKIFKLDFKQNVSLKCN